MNIGTKRSLDLSYIAPGVDQKLIFNSKDSKMHKKLHKLDLTPKAINVRALYLKWP